MAPRRPIRLGFDARLIENSGIGRYIQSLLSRLPGPDLEVVAWMSSEQARDPRWAFPGVERRVLDAKIFSIAEQLKLPQAVRDAHVDLLHVPHLNAPLFSPVPLIVTLHDLIPFHYPEAIAARFGNVYFRAMSQMVPRRAQSVLVVSENTRRDLIQLAGAPESKLEVVPIGVDEAFAIPGPPERREAVRERYGLPGRYFLYAGQWKGYKNVELLLAVMERLPDLRDTKLVLVGKEDSRVGMREMLARRGLQDRVVLTGFVEDEADLIALYQEATLFLFPSRYEGFGLPPLEAMAAGVPVLASDRASIPEVVGSAGLLLDPDRVLEWQQAIESLCADPARCELLSTLGRARSREFSWEQTVTRTIAAYRRVLEGTKT